MLAAETVAGKRASGGPVGQICDRTGSTDLSVRNIHEKMAGRVSRGIVGKITKRVRSPRSPPL
jgi:hypothetical protein